ncbi:hypothetical protein F9B74_02110 [Pelistega sp. NLN82]|uniref:Uncharacterized protein n=1 Tax=Pelistega ratti TaxID=2652177 RepID=A0A6L9Y401_9BURK|nr:hypothetical protein [Pelistega ratti]NEN75121.1 hypothetical protein [Pelistega ratti]
MAQDKQLFNYSKELKSIAKGSKKSLQSLYQQEAGNMLTFAFKTLQHYKFAEEAVIETFTLIWNNAKYYDESMGYARGWIYTIFRYHLHNITQKNYIALKENLKGNTSTFLGEICTNLYVGVDNFKEHGSFYQILEELPEDIQRSLMTTYFSGESLADTATLLNISLGKLKEDIRTSIRYLAQKRQPLNIKHDHTCFIGEFVLGSLNTQEQQKANDLLANDPVAEQISLIWEEEFLHFLSQLIIEKTPESLWVRIKQATITEKDTSTDMAELEDELALSQAENDPSFLHKATYFTKKCWISRNFWRGTSFALLGLMVALLIIRPFEYPIKIAAVLNATLQPNQVGYTVKQDKQLTITPLIHQSANDQLGLQLWHRDAQGMLHPITILADNKPTILDYQSQFKVGDLLLISLEPKQSGQISHQLTGQILYQGTLVSFE